MERLRTLSLATADFEGYRVLSRGQRAAFAKSMRGFGARFVYIVRSGSEHASRSPSRRPRRMDGFIVGAVVKVAIAFAMLAIFLAVQFL
jgi:hypothetical protein